MLLHVLVLALVLPLILLRVQCTGTSNPPPNLCGPHHSRHQHVGVAHNHPWRRTRAATGEGSRGRQSGRAAFSLLLWCLHHGMTSTLLLHALLVGQ